MLNVGVSQYLVASRALHDDSRSHRQRRHGQHGYNHPLGPGELGVHAQDDVLLVRDALEDLVHALGAQQDLLLLGVLVDVLPLGVQLQARAPDAGLVAATATVALDGTTEGELGEKRIKPGRSVNIESRTVFYLLLGDVLLRLLLLHAELVVHLLASFADVFAFAQLVHVCQTLPRLPFGLTQDVFDLWIVLEVKATAACHTSKLQTYDVGQYF